MLQTHALMKFRTIFLKNERHGYQVPLGNGKYVRQSEVYERRRQHQRCQCLLLCCGTNKKRRLILPLETGGRGYVFWGGREGYETLLNTDVKFEQENIASLMHMAVEYGRSIGFKGDFYIEPKPKEPMTHQYDFDAATAIGF